MRLKVLFISLHLMSAIKASYRQDFVSFGTSFNLRGFAKEERVTRKVADDIDIINNKLKFALLIRTKNHEPF